MVPPRTQDTLACVFVLLPVTTIHCIRGILLRGDRNLVSCRIAPLIVTCSASPSLGNRFGVYAQASRPPFFALCLLLVASSLSFDLYPMLSFGFVGSYSNFGLQ